MLGAIAKQLGKQLGGKSIGSAVWNHKGKIAGAGAAGIFGKMEYDDYREQGEGKVASAIGAVADVALPFLMGGPAYMGYLAVTELPGLAVSAVDSFDQYRRKIGREMHGHAFQNDSFNDNQQVHTMRQAGMAIAQRSRYNTKQAMIGNEAKYMMK